MYSDYGYGAASSSINSGSAAVGVLGVVMAFLAIIVLICLVIAVITIAGEWKMFKKAGEDGWKAIIPIYNQYTLCKIVGVSPWWILIVFLVSLLSFIPLIGSLISLAASIYFLILLSVSTARSYGKDDGFAVGLALLSPIFYAILGFGNSEYQGPKPMNDIVFQKAKEMQENNTTKATNAANDKNTKFCSNCGTKVNTKTKFCPNCGTELK